MKQTNNNEKSALVVEDEAGIAELCTRVLRAAGFQVKVVPDGKAALDLLNDDKEFVFLLIDIRTPEMNGIELYRHLENIYPEIAHKVVFTTGDVLSGDIKTFLDEAECLYLVKPFTPDELKAMVKNVLDGKE